MKAARFARSKAGTVVAYIHGMNLKDATSKAEHLAESGPAVVVSVSDPAHGDGVGENRFDAVTREVFEADQRGGMYLTLWRSIHRRKHEDG